MDGFVCCLSLFSLVFSFVIVFVLWLCKNDYLLYHTEYWILNSEYWILNTVLLCVVLIFLCEKTLRVRFESTAWLSYFKLYLVFQFTFLVSFCHKLSLLSVSLPHFDSKEIHKQGISTEDDKKVKSAISWDLTASHAYIYTQHIRQMRRINNEYVAYTAPIWHEAVWHLLCCNLFYSRSLLLHWFVWFVTKKII